MRISEADVPFDIPCYWEKYHGRISCSDWLVGLSDIPPDHVCYDIARASVEMFAAKKFVITCPTDKYYCSDWPLPVGVQAILTWRNQFGERWGYTIPDDWFIQPTLEASEAMIGLAVSRRSEAGTAWLLGLVERVWPQTPNADATLDELRQYWESLQMAEQLHSHKFAGAAIFCEGDWRALAAQIDKLETWYRARILGQTIGGRPRDTGLFQTDHLRRAALRNGLQRGGQPLVAEVVLRAWSLGFRDAVCEHHQHVVFVHLAGL